MAARPSNMPKQDVRAIKMTEIANRARDLARVADRQNNMLKLAVKVTRTTTSAERASVRVN